MLNTVPILMQLFFSVAGIEFKGQKRPEEIPKAKNLVDNFARLGSSRVYGNEAFFNGGVAQSGYE